MSNLMGSCVAPTKSYECPATRDLSPLLSTHDLSSSTRCNHNQCVLFRSRQALLDYQQVVSPPTTILVSFRRLFFFFFFFFIALAAARMALAPLACSADPRLLVDAVIRMGEGGGPVRTCDAAADLSRLAADHRTARCLRRPARRVTGHRSSLTAGGGCGGGTTRFAPQVEALSRRRAPEGIRCG